MGTPRKLIAGIDLGGTNMQFGIVGPDGAILARAKRKTKAEESREAILARICSGIEQACEALRVTPDKLSAIGIGAPGAVDPERGVVLEAVNLRWDNVPLAELLSKRLKAPVYVDNDVNAAVYGEWRAGAGRAHDNLLGVWVGTGIGGGLILNGALYYGHYLTAGEIGHVILLPNNPPGSRSLEHNCSRTAVVDRIVRLMRSNRKSMIAALVEGDFAAIRSRTVARAYEAGDELTLEVVDHAADLLGSAIAGFVTVLSLPCVVLGGGLVEAMGKQFVDRVQRSVRKYAFPERCRQVVVVASRLEDDAGVLGAALIAQERLRSRRRR